MWKFCYTPKIMKRPAVRRAASRGKALAPPVRPAVDLGRGLVRCKADAARYGLEPLLAAAYLLTDRAYAWLDGARTGAVTVCLQPKGERSSAALKALAAAFAAEVSAQALRWSVARKNQPIREFIIEQAVLNAGAAPPEEPAPEGEQLTEDQKKEIERLIAEVETEIKAIHETKAGQDPKKISASWEQTHTEPDAPTGAS